jgi:alkanesulfonate monooxygenase SsuD/methylene tetrahydromethanopterin reductase-like flavin-dependent oxidoreductase (luciferase family)
VIAAHRRVPIKPRPTVAEMVDALRALLGGETVNHRGGGFSFSNARLDYGRPDLESSWPAEAVS